MAEIKAPEGPGSEGDTEKAKLSLWSQAFLKTGQASNDMGMTKTGKSSEGLPWQQ